jgi:hypothetical protein
MLGSRTTASRTPAAPPRGRGSARSLTRQPARTNPAPIREASHKAMPPCPVKAIPPQNCRPKPPLTPERSFRDEDLLVGSRQRSVPGGMRRPDDVGVPGGVVPSVGECSRGAFSRYRFGRSHSAVPGWLGAGATGRPPPAARGDRAMARRVRGSRALRMYLRTAFRVPLMDRAVAQARPARRGRSATPALPGWAFGLGPTAWLRPWRCRRGSRWRPSRFFAVLRARYCRGRQRRRRKARA